ncbi:hypothetical protein BMS3Bbin04_01374 [bacterium BMS3Bbin04]|nr:hypothetical protein BMS3Bbin04_01374 [bacterium BMS3Bbin04]
MTVCKMKGPLRADGMRQSQSRADLVRCFHRREFVLWLFRIAPSFRTWIDKIIANARIYNQVIQLDLVLDEGCEFQRILFKTVHHTLPFTVRADAQITDILNVHAFGSELQPCRPQVYRIHLPVQLRPVVEGFGATLTPDIRPVILIIEILRVGEICR